ncbi:MAG: response regulator transcription factor [Bacteroidales bacterium]|nr:response regulator transcription factor [Bacteroidales bacterium]
MKTNCLIVDDEPLSIKLIKGYINELDDFVLVGEARNALEALKIMEIEKIDLMFLDINMPRISGLELVKSIQYPPKIVLISGHKEYAIDGFELCVVDYLLKPISFDRFLKAVNKYKGKQILESRRERLKEKSEEKILSLKDNKKVYNVNLKDILYIESLREYVKIYSDSANILIKCALSKLDEGLPPDGFIRIHKSYIVAMNKVKVFSATSVEVGDKTIPIGRNYKSTVIKKLNNYGFFI